MAFKKMTDYNEAKYSGFFVLRNDGDYADVIFLYRDTDDVLMADVHYIKSESYSGYVHCLGKGCPACEKGIRVESKLFIPVYNIKEDEIQFFDRSIRFENQLQQDVFANYPNPSEYVFRITRHGAAGSRDTRYEIRVLARNTGDGKVGSYEELLARCDAKMPDKYEDVCKEFSGPELAMMLNSAPSGVVNPSEMPDYQITPRAVATSSQEVTAESVEAVAPVIPEVVNTTAADGPALPPDLLVEDVSDIEDVKF